MRRKVPGGNQQSLLQALLDASTAVIYVKDTQGRYLLVNRRHEILAGIPQDQIRGKTDLEIFPKDIAELLRANDATVLQSGQPAEWEETVASADGPHTYLSLKFPIRDSAGVPWAVGGISADITDRKRAELTERKQAEDALRRHQAELQRSQEELRRLTAGLFAAQEEERRRVSRELHDDLSQKLAMLAVEVETMERDLPESAELIRDALRSLRERTDKVSDDARRTAYQLHPSILEHLGLVAALRSYCSDFSKQEGIRVRFTHRDVPQGIPHEAALCLYRVTQESLRNVAKHSGHTRASVTLTGTEDKVHLSISDRGVGFEPDLVKGKGGLGIVSMEERVRLAGGIVSINSRPGDGARIDVQIPITRGTQ